MKLAVVFTLGFSVLGFPLLAEPLQFPKSTSVEQEGRIDMSTRILRDAFFTIDNDIVGIVRYPLENPETTQLFLPGSGR